MLICYHGSRKLIHHCNQATSFTSLVMPCWCHDPDTRQGGGHRSHCDSLPPNSASQPNHEKTPSKPKRRDILENTQRALFKTFKVIKNTQKLRSTSLLKMMIVMANIYEGITSFKPHNHAYEAGTVTVTDQVPPEVDSKIEVRMREIHQNMCLRTDLCRGRGGRLDGGRSWAVV